MAKMTSFTSSNGYIQGKPKMTCQGKSQNTKLSATSRNNAKKRYRGQGRQGWRSGAASSRPLRDVGVSCWRDRKSVV